MDCDDATLLLAVGESRTLTVAEAGKLHDHAEGCTECRALIDDRTDKRFRPLVSIPEDALDKPDLLVLPQFDPSAFISQGELARGGMGRITRARDRRLGRDVAIKEVIAPGMRARFEREVMITAQLQHPAIIPVYEAGTWPSGTAFYTMRLVSGGTLADAIGKTKTLEERLALLPHVVALTDALAYAHSKRIVHRDLKPGNVLVGEFGETVVIDWGLAKELDREAPEPLAALVAPRTSDLTIAGSVMGTPGFLAPEQAVGGDVDERADVYALGAILYNLLTGAPPYFDQPDKTAETLIELARTQPPTPLAELAPRTPRDLVAIAERAMAREPAARYRSAKELTEELRRFQAGQLLRSREYRIRELVARWIRRHRAAVSVGAFAIGVLAVVAVVSVREIVRRKNQAELALAKSELEQARQLLVAGEPEQAAPHLAAAVIRLPDDAVAQRLVAIATRDTDRRIATLHGTAAAFAPDGKTLALGRADGSIALVDPVNGSEQRTLPALGARIEQIAYAGDAIVTASPAGAYLREPAGRTVTLAEGVVSDVVLAGELVALSTREGIRLVRRDGSPSATAAAPGAFGLDVSPDGAMLLACGTEHTIVWTLPALAVVAELPPSRYARFDGAGGVVIADNAGLRRVLLAHPGEPVLLRRSEPQPIERLATGALANYAEVVDPATNTTHPFAPGSIGNEIASIDRTHVISGGYDRLLRIWDLERAARPVAVLAAAEATSRIVVDRAGTRAVSIGDRDGIELWNVGQIGRASVVARLGGPIGNLESAGGKLAAWLDDGDDRAVVLGGAAPVPGWLVGFLDGDVVVNNKGKLYVHGVHPRTIADAKPIGAAGSSHALLATEAGGHVTLRDPHDGALRGGFDLPAADATAVAVDDANHVITGHEDGTLRIWDARTGALQATLRGHTAHVGTIILRGDRMVTVSWDQTARTWTLPAGAAGAVVPAPAGKVALSPDGRWLATAEHDGIARVWDAAEGRLIEQIAASEPLDAIAFVDADHLAVGGTAGVVERIDLAR